MLIPIDVTTSDLTPEGNYVATVTAVEYQAKTGEKWNKEGTSTVTQDEWLAFSPDKRRIQLTLALQGGGTIFHNLYMKESALIFVKRFLKAAGVKFGKEGFDPDELVGKEVGVSISIGDDPEYGPRNEIDKIYKV